MTVRISKHTTGNIKVYKINKSNGGLKKTPKPKIRPISLIDHSKSVKIDKPKPPVKTNNINQIIQVNTIADKLVNWENLTDTNILNYICEEDYAANNGYNESFLICIFNYQHDENAERWLNLLSPHFKTIVLDSGNDKLNEKFIQYPNIYYSGLFNETKKISELGNYEWVGIICSDVIIDNENSDKLIERLKWLVTTKNIGVWQPDGTKDGHTSSVMYDSNLGFRYLEGYLQFIKMDVLNEQDYIDLKLNKYGHGIDYVTCFISNKKNYINYLDENVIVYHPKEKGYDGNSAREMSIEFIKKLRETKFPTLKVLVKNKSFLNNIIKYKERKPPFTCDLIEYSGGKKTPMFVSMTSWKDRIKYVPLAIQSIKQQSLKPDKIFLWLSSEEISYDEIPSELLNEELLEIKWVDKNLKSFKKFLTIKQHPNAFNFVLDDDFYYHKTFIEELYNCSINNNHDGIICYSCNTCNANGEPWGGVNGEVKINYKWVSGGVTLYPPFIFPQIAFDYYYDIMYDLELQSDETFIMPFIVKNKIPIHTVTSSWDIFFSKTKVITDSQKYALHKKFFQNEKNFNSNKKNQLLFDILQKLPIEYLRSYKEVFTKNRNDIDKLNVFKNNKKIVVTITSWTKRINNLTQVLECVLKNSLLPNKIYINLSTEEFKNKELDLPKELLNLMENFNIVEILWLKHNTKTMKKLFPTLNHCSESDIIINLDDDILIESDFIETRYNDFIKNNCNPITGFMGKIDGLEFSSGGSIFTKKMFYGLNKFLTKEVLETYEDDWVYSYLCILNGYRFKIASKYNVKDLKFIVDNNSAKSLGIYNTIKTESILNQRINNLFNIKKLHEINLIKNIQNNNEQNNIGNIIPKKTLNNFYNQE